MQNLIATTFEVVHYIALQAVHYKPLQEVHLSRYNHVTLRCEIVSVAATASTATNSRTSVTVEIRMKNMDKNRYFLIRSGKCTKTKVTDIQRLYSKWLWLVTVV